MVALTFDAGNTAAGSAGSILDTLKSHNFKATFFLAGTWIDANPGLVSRMVNEGHQIGNHSYNHPDMTTLAPDQMTSQITTTEAAARSISSSYSLKPFFRPPYGSYNSTLLGVLGQSGYDLVMWTLDSGDWVANTPSPDAIYTKVTTNAEAGYIVVFHAHVTNTALAMPRIRDWLISEGLRGGTVSQAFGP